MRAWAIALAIALCTAALAAPCDAANRRGLVFGEDNCQNIEPLLEKAVLDSGVMFAPDDKTRAHRPDSLFAGEADPRQILAKAAGNEVLPMDDFVAINRGDRLAIDQPGAAAHR